MSNEMQSWTGYTGARDAELRASGQTFLLGFRPGDNDLMLLGRDEIDRGDYDEYVNIAAPDEPTARENYDRAFLQWRDSENGTNDLGEYTSATDGA